MVPEYVARHWWERILYNQSAKRLRTALLGRPHTVVVNVPYRREDPIFESRAKAAGPEPARPDRRRTAAGWESTPARTLDRTGAQAPRDAPSGDPPHRDRWYRHRR